MKRNVFGSTTMAEGYAQARPPLHGLIVERALAAGPQNRTRQRALDIGCGSGLSAEALRRYAEHVTAVDPNESMVDVAARLFPLSHYVVAAAEALPFGSITFDLISAAGSLNYVDPVRFLAETRRVLRPRGMALIYDFGRGTVRDWVDRFESRYPDPPGSALEFGPESFSRATTGMELIASQRLALSLNMTAQEFLAYNMTETNVAYAIETGEPEAAIRQWCQGEIAALFDGAAQEIRFPAYFALMANP